MLITAVVLAALLTPVPSSARSSVLRDPGAPFSGADTLLVCVELAYTPEARVLVAVPVAGALLLPTAELSQFLDVKLPAAAWTSTVDLERLFPIRLDWRPRELRLVIYDDQGALGLTRSYRGRIERRVRAAPNLGASGGFWGSVAADDSARSRAELGYYWHNVIGLSGAWSSSNNASWSATVAATPWAYASYSSAVGQPANVTARLAAGPAFVAASWSGSQVTADGLITISRASLFLSTRDLWLVTINSPAGAIQVGRARGSIAARYSFGVIPSSPFLYPITR